MKKYSRQRETIREALAGVTSHPSASEIYEMVRAKIPNIRLGTVYRNLSMLADEGDILRISTGEGIERFDATTDSHSHLVCRCCGKVTDIDIPAYELDRTAEKISGAKIESHSLIFYVTCPECAKKKLS